MGKFVHNDVLDAGLILIRDNATRMVVLTGLPADYAGVAALTLGQVAVTPADFVISDGTVSGRKMVVSAKADIPVTVTDTADHIGLVDDNLGRLLFVTEPATPKDVAAAGTVSQSAWPIEFTDPV